MLLRCPCCRACCCLFACRHAVHIPCILSPLISWLLHLSCDAGSYVPKAFTQTLPRGLMACHLKAVVASFTAGVAHVQQQPASYAAGFRQPAESPAPKVPTGRTALFTYLAACCPFAHLLLHCKWQQPNESAARTGMADGRWAQAIEHGLAVKGTVLPRCTGSPLLCSRLQHIKLDREAAGGFGLLCKQLRNGF